MQASLPIVIFTFVLVAVFQPAYGLPEHPPEKTPLPTFNEKLKAEVSSTWEQYKQRVAAGNNEGASALLTRASIKQYAMSVSWALYGTNEELELLPLFDHFGAVANRIRLKPDRLRELEDGGVGYFSMGLEKQWFGHFPKESRVSEI